MKCPVHGVVDEDHRTHETSGALSNCWPYPVLCIDCLPALVIVGFEDEEDREVDAEGDPV